MVLHIAVHSDQAKGGLAKAGSLADAGEHQYGLRVSERLHNTGHAVGVKCYYPGTESCQMLYIRHPTEWSFVIIAEQR